jgi:hypothetical protein
VITPDTGGGWLTNLITLWVEALSDVFDAEFPDPDFRGISVSPEYPVEQTHYPGLWVDFTPTADMRTVGIGHRELSAPASDGTFRTVGRWSFQGVMQVTVVTLNNLERARLVDHLTNLWAFGGENPSLSEFRARMEDNDLLALTVQWDQFNWGGKAEAPGTPWNSPEVVYEITATFTLEGTFVSSGSERTLVPLSSVTVYDNIEGEPPQPNPDTGGDWI